MADDALVGALEVARRQPEVRGDDGRAGQAGSGHDGWDEGRRRAGDRPTDERTAGTGRGPRSVFEHLLEVQDHDTALDQLRHRKSALPEQAELAGVEARLAALEARAAEVQVGRDELGVRQAALEEQIEALAGAAGPSSRSRMYGGQVSAARDLQAMDEEVNHLKRHISELEDREIEIMEALEPHRRRAGQLDARREALWADRDRLRGAIAEAVVGSTPTSSPRREAAGWPRGHRPRRPPGPLRAAAHDPGGNRGRPVGGRFVQRLSPVAAGHGGRPHPQGPARRGDHSATSAVASWCGEGAACSSWSATANRPPTPPACCSGRADRPLTERRPGPGGRLSAACGRRRPPDQQSAGPGPGHRRRPRAGPSASRSTSGGPRSTTASSKGKPWRPFPPRSGADGVRSPTSAPRGARHWPRWASGSGRLRGAVRRPGRGGPAAGDVVVVSHVSPIKAAVAWALGAGDDLAWRLHLSTASLTRVAWGVDRPVLHCLQPDLSPVLTAGDRPSDRGRSATAGFGPRNR